MRAAVHCGWEGGNTMNRSFLGFAGLLLLACGGSEVNVGGPRLTDGGDNPGSSTTGGGSPSTTGGGFSSTSAGGSSSPGSGGTGGASVMTGGGGAGMMTQADAAPGGGSDAAPSTADAGTDPIGTPFKMLVFTKAVA